jgi:myo-inositol-1(or 4)-monophosphatase
MKQFLDQIVRRAGDISLEYREKLSSLEIRNKSPKDLVTDADHAVEQYLVGEIRSQYPGHSIIAEETGSHGGDGTCWIIDPIDGTGSFVHGQPFYSVSIAVQRENEAMLAAVNAPVLREVYTAEKGGGAYCNGEPIRVSSCESLIEAMVGTGFACLRSDMEYNNLPFFAEIAPRVRGIRRYGSAAIDMCYIARGMLDGFWELNLKDVDIAAGKLIIEEAGGIVTDFEGGQEGLPGEVIAGNIAVQDLLLECCKKVKQGF